MIMKFSTFKKILLAALAAAVGASCATSEEPPYSEIENRALDNWIKANAPGAQKLGDTGVYYETLAAAESDGDLDVRGKWVDIEYTLRNLDGDIIYTRNEDVARILGTYDAYTHYVPARLYVAGNPNSSNIPLGLYQALTSIPQGEMWRVYIPSEHGFGAYGFKSGNGYAGQKTLGANMPVVVDSLRILNVIENPQTEGIAAVKALATAPKPEGWGLEPSDTVRKNMYMEIYNRVSSVDTVVMNTSANIYYKVRYMDGKLLNSNVDSVLTNNFGTVRSQDITSPVRLTRMESAPANANQMPARIFYTILSELRYGDIGRIVVPADYGYSSHFMPPNKNEDQWEFAATFESGLAVNYDDYSTAELDAYFGASFYIPYTTTIVSIGEVNPYQPLIYEFIVQRADE